MTALLTSLFTLITGILLPAGGMTPISTLAWFGLLAPAILFTIGFVRNLARASSS